MKPRGGEGQNGRLKCPMGFLVQKDFAFDRKPLIDHNEYYKVKYILWVALLGAGILTTLRHCQKSAEIKLFFSC